MLKKLFKSKTVQLFNLFCVSVMCAQLFAEDVEPESAFVERMVKTHQFDKEALVAILKKAKKQQKILDLMSKPAEGLPWHKYRQIWIKPKRINDGVKFWNQYSRELQRAEATFQVPASMIVSILGVETFYGRIQGKISVLDALYTLGFHYPKRAKFFNSELEHFLVLCKEQGWDPIEPKGSYAGAMGMGQFISSTYRHYAVDFDGDGKIDLFNNPVDIIGSVANYFRKHKWRWGEPVAFKVTQQGTDSDKWEASKLKPTSTAGEIKSDGFLWPIDTVDEQRASIYAFEQEKGNDYWVGFDNFYVITRYNRSPLYALAVYQLSQEIVAARAASYWHH